MDEMTEWSGMIVEEAVYGPSLTAPSPALPVPFQPQPPQAPPPPPAYGPMPQPVPAAYGPPPMPQPVQAMPPGYGHYMPSPMHRRQAMGALEQPPPSMPMENGHSLGLALLLLSTGTGLGLYYGGAFGGVAGALFAGCAVNGIRAARYMAKGSPAADHEAFVSGTYAVVSAAAAGYLSWRIYSAKHTTPKLG